MQKLEKLRSALSAVENVEKSFEEVGFLGSVQVSFPEGTEKFVSPEDIRAVLRAYKRRLNAKLTHEEQKLIKRRGA